MRETVRIPNELGLHMRAAKVFVEAAGRWESEIHVARGELRINGKSIMGLMMLAAPLGTEIVLEVEGRDEQAAMQDLLELVRSGFGEGVAKGDGKT